MYKSIYVYIMCTYLSIYTFVCAYINVYKYTHRYHIYIYNHLAIPRFIPTVA